MDPGKSQKIDNSVKSHSKTDKAQDGQIDIEKISKSIALCFGIFYAIGFFILNSYLYSIGISEFSLFKPRYIYIGIITFFPILFTVFILVVNLHIITKLDSDYIKGLSPSFVKKLFPIYKYSLLISPFVVLYLIFHELFSQDPVYSIVGTIISLFIGIAIARNHILTKLIGSNKDKILNVFINRNKVTTKLPNIISLVIISIAYSYFFSIYILDKIPEQFGGLKPKSVILLIDEDSKKGLRELGLEFNDESPLTTKLNLLFENESIYVLRKSNSNIICLDKRNVKATEIIND